MDINVIPLMEQAKTFNEKITLLSQHTAVIQVPLRLENSSLRCKISYPLQFNLKTSPSRGTQFAGFHSCLVLTITRPVICQTIQTISQIMPQIPGFGYITWACPIIHKKGYNSKIASTTIPNIIWHKNPVGNREYLDTVGYLSNLTVTFPYPTGAVQTYTFSILQIPSINREHFGPQSISHDWTPTPKKETT